MSEAVTSRFKSTVSGPAMQQIIALAALVALYIFFSIFGQRFLSGDTFSILSSSYYIGFLAIGMTFVIITGGIDPLGWNRYGGIGAGRRRGVQRLGGYLSTWRSSSSSSLEHSSA